jgi:hypothetical protein
MAASPEVAGLGQMSALDCVSKDARLLQSPSTTPKPIGAIRRCAETISPSTEAAAVRRRLIGYGAP